MPFIGDLDPTDAIAPEDQFPLDHANSDGTTDTLRASAALLASWLTAQVAGSVAGPAAVATAAALVAAKAYADQVSAAVGSAATGHADANLVTAKNYADEVGGTATSAVTAGLVAAKAYTDAAIIQSEAPIAGLLPSSTIAADDMVAISIGGVDRRIRYADFVDGETVDQLAAAVAAADTDVLIVGQGSSTMAAQTFSALWTWISAHLAGWKRPVVEVSTNTQLDGSIHNRAILVCPVAVTITPAFLTEGSGFGCTIVNASAGNVTLGAGFTTSSGLLAIPPGQSGEVVAASYTGGSLNFVTISLASGVLAVPGQVTGLASGVTTSSTVALSWTAPASGGAPAFYSVRWRVTGAGAWANSATASGTSFIVTGLAAATGYDFRVSAVNNGGTGTASVTATGTTGAAPTFVPNMPTVLGHGTATATTMPVSWLASVTDGTHNAANSYTVQWRLSSGGGWTQQTGIAGVSYTVTGLTAATGYDFQVQAVNAIGASAFTSTVTGTTAAAPAFAPNVPTSLAHSTATTTTMPLTWAAPVVDGSHGSALTYTVQWRQTGGSTWTQATGVAALGYTVTGLSSLIGYDFQVSAVNATGSSTFTATVTGTTAAPVGNYAMGSGYFPGGHGTTYAHGALVTDCNVSDMSIAGDGSHTVPANVYFGWNNSPTVPPATTAGMKVADGQFSNGGHNYWYAWNINAPATPGTYYFWAVKVDGGGAIVASNVQNNQPIAGGTPYVFTIT